MRALAAGRLAVAFLFAAVLVSATGVSLAFASSPEVVASAPADGAQAVPCEGRIWVQFENNVAAVPDNASLVALETADGARVAPERYEVSLPDAELEFAYRQYIWIDVNGLDPGTGYAIHVAPGVTSKNGSVNDAETLISFTTAPSDAEAAALASPVAVERGSGNGDGTGGGASGNQGGGAGGGQSDSTGGGASGDTGGGQGGGNTAAVPDAQAGSAGEDGKSESGAGSRPGSANGIGTDASNGDDETEVLYVDAKGNPVNEADKPSEPMPAGEVALFVLCGAIVAVALVFAVFRSRSNVMRGQR